MDSRQPIKIIAEEFCKNGLAPVTVIIPCYDAEKTIAKAIESVFGQSWRPKELIVINDASYDRTADILNELYEKFGKNWLKVVNFEKNQGPSIARNKGWEISTQPYIAFLDADDYWNKDKIAIQMYFMLEKKLEISGHLYLCNIKDKKLDYSSFPTNEIKVTGIPKRSWLFKNYYATQGVMLKRELPQRFVPFRNYSEDYSLWLRVAFAGCRMSLINLPLAYGNKSYIFQKGLSKSLWKMEKAQLEDFIGLFRQKNINISELSLTIFWSFIKFFERILMSIFYRFYYHKQHE